MSKEIRQGIENNIKSSTKPQAFGIVLRAVEQIAKVLSVFIGSIYMIGYIVIAAQLYYHMLNRGPKAVRSPLDA